MEWMAWVVLAVLAVVVVWMMMRQNSALPAPGMVDAYGQPLPIGGFANPSANSADGGLAASIANAVSSAFNLAGNIATATANRNTTR